MPIGTALLQPYGLRRDGQNPLISLGEDVLRLAAILAEDASAGGPIAKAMGDGLQEAVEVLLQAKDMPRVGAHGFKKAVAVEEAVVERRDYGLASGEQGAVQVY